MTTASFLAWFETTFGEAFPFSIAANLERTPEATHWATELRPELSASALMAPRFPEQPDRFVVAGQWGFGLVSPAFYWIERASAHRYFFRLPLGGAYGRGPADDKAEVVRFLEGLDAWRRAMSARVVESTLVWSLGTASGELRLAAGTTLKIDDVPRMPNGAVCEASAWWPWLREKVDGA